MDIPHGGSSRPLFPDGIEIENVGFLRREENRRTRRKTRGPGEKPVLQGREQTTNPT